MKITPASCSGKLNFWLESGKGILFGCLIFLTGCSHDITTVMVPQKIEGAKVIAMDAPAAPWVAPIELRLRQKGFKVLRWASQRQVQEQAGETRLETYNEASTRYVLVIRGRAYMDQMNRCFGGGFKFDFINAELVDSRTNETLVTYSGSGYSEDCPPASGNIFENVSAVVLNAWGSGEQNQEVPTNKSMDPPKVIGTQKGEPKRQTEPSKDIYVELTKLDELRKKGILTEDEFQAQKKKILEQK